MLVILFEAPAGLYQRDIAPMSEMAIFRQPWFSLVG
jgi:hypothetical protein